MSEVFNLPDVGAENVDIVEVQVSAGDSVSAGDVLMVLETDKASMEIEAPGDGTVDEMIAAVGNKISNGDPVMKWTPAGAVATPPAAAPAAAAPEPAPTPAATPVAGAAEVFNLPDVGAENVDIVEVQVSAGDSVSAGDVLMVLETDKASMEIEAPGDGIINEMIATAGGKISNGDPVMKWTPAGAAAPAAAAPAQAASPAATTAPAATTVPAPTPAPAPASSGPVVYNLPDVGAENVDIVEVQVSAGDSVSAGDVLMVLETDKASMEIEAPGDGIINEMIATAGGKISNGDPVMKWTPAGAAAAAPAQAASPVATAPAATAPAAVSGTPGAPAPTARKNASVHAGPAVRRIANEFGVDLTQVTGTGPKGRILKEDVQAWVKGRVNTPAPVAQVVVAPTAPAAPAAGGGVEPLPSQDFSKFGEVEEREAPRITQMAAKGYRRNWLNTPMVTQFDEADITKLEKLRQKLQPDAIEAGTKITPLSFMVKAVAIALQRMPEFNVSMSPDDSRIIQKKYVNVGIAVDTPHGLFVPVVKDADSKGLLQISKDIIELAGKAKNKQLKPAEMSGGSITITSLGGIGGTAFTPLVNSPEVAILGVSKSQIKPIWHDKKGKFRPRLMCPLSLSYDHKAINGANAARFTSLLAELLGDANKLLL